YEPGRWPERTALRRGLSEALVRGLDAGAESFGLGFALVVLDGFQRVDGAIDELVRVAHVPVAFGRDLLARRDQLPKAPLFQHDSGVSFDVRYGRRRVCKLREVRRAPHLRHAFTVSQQRGDGHDIDGSPARGNVARGFVYPAVRVA